MRPYGVAPALRLCAPHPILEDIARPSRGQNFDTETFERVVPKEV